MSGKPIGELKRARGQLDFQWEIPDFLSLPTDVDKWHDSPDYFFGDASWHIRVYPNGESDYSSEGFIGMYVFRRDSGPGVNAIFSLGIKTNGSFEGEKVGGFTRIFDGSSGFGFPKALKTSDLIDRASEYMPSGALTFLCSLKFPEEEATKDGSKEPVAVAQNAKLLRDYMELLKSEENCDVTLEVSGQKFKAHRAILGARSPVFASMMKHNMKEKNTGLINIKDIDKDVFMDFLHFLYCGSVENLTSENMCSLYRAADKYDVQDLKTECLTHIKSYIDVETFCDIITLALQHSESDLIKKASDFFAKNLPKIIVTVKWQEFLNENTTQGNELLIKALVHDKS